MSEAAAQSGSASPSPPPGPADTSSGTPAPAGSPAPSQESEIIAPALWSGSGWVILVSNLLPLAGVWLAGWKVSDFVLLFWFDIIIVGLFGLVKVGLIGRWLALYMVPVFAFLFACYVGMLYLFVDRLFLTGDLSGITESTRGVSSEWMIGASVVALFIARATTFWTATLRLRQWRDEAVEQVMIGVFMRVLLMVMLIAAAGGFMVVNETPVVMLVAMVGCKALAEWAAHYFAQRQRQRPEPQPMQPQPDELSPDVVAMLEKAEHLRQEVDEERR